MGTRIWVKKKNPFDVLQESKAFLEIKILFVRRKKLKHWGKYSKVNVTNKINA